MKIVISVLFVFCFIATGSAQERIIDKAEFDTIIAEGYSHKLKWKDEKYRLTVTTSSTVTGRPQTDFSSRGVIEVGPSMENRTINSSTFGGKPTPTRESLRIANWVYTRSGNDGWTRMQYSATPTAKETEESPFQVLSSQAEYTYLGEGKLMDKPVQIFLKTERQTKVNQKSGEASETESRNKYWIGPNGMVLKSDFIAETRGKTTSRTTVVMEWQIDPSITFTLPEIFP